MILGMIYHFSISYDIDGHQIIYDILSFDIIYKIIHKITSMISYNDIHDIAVWCWLT